jgi:hypothetical protein
MPSIRRGLLGLSVLVFLAITSCRAPVTLDGQSVTNETVITATRAVTAADRTAAAAVHFLITYRQTQCALGPTSPACMQATAALRTYAKEIGPKLQTALDVAREVLITAVSAPQQTTAEQVQKALAEVETVLQGLIILAQQMGWTPR